MPAIKRLHRPLKRKGLVSFRRTIKNPLKRKGLVSFDRSKPSFRGLNFRGNIGRRVDNSVKDFGELENVIKQINSELGYDFAKIEIDKNNPDVYLATIKDYDSVLEVEDVEDFCVDLETLNFKYNSPELKTALSIAKYYK